MPWLGVARPFLTPLFWWLRDSYVETAFFILGVRFPKEGTTPIWAAVNFKRPQKRKPTLKRGQLSFFSAAPDTQIHQGASESSRVQVCLKARIDARTLARVWVHILRLQNAFPRTATTRCTDFYPLEPAYSLCSNRLECSEGMELVRVCVCVCVCVSGFVHVLVAVASK